MTTPPFILLVFSSSDAGEIYADGVGGLSAGVNGFFVSSTSSNCEVTGLKKKCQCKVDSCIFRQS